MFNNKLPLKKSEQGITLIETLVGIIIATVFLVAISPPLLIAMNNRIQTRRAQQAMEIAQQEIERVRLLVESGNYGNSDLPPDTGTSVLTKTISSYGAPTSFCGGPGDAACGTITGLVARDVDGSGSFYIQTFRRTQVPDVAGKSVIFRIGVRVYAGTAKANVASLNNSTNTPGLSITGGSGLGNQRLYPLSVYYSDFSGDDLSNRLIYQRTFSNQIK